MIPKRARLTGLYNLGLGSAILVVSNFSGGHYYKMMWPLAMAIILAGVVAFIVSTIRGKDSERECDERELLINHKAAKATVIFTSYLLTAYWAYEVAVRGTFIFTFTYLVIAMWGFYLLAYLFYKFRM